MDSAATKQAGDQAGGNTAKDAQAVAAAAPVLRRWIAEREKVSPRQGSAPAGKTSAGQPVSFRLERAAEIALGRAAEKQARLPVFVETVEFGRMTLPELPEFLPERALLIVIEGKRDEIGVVALCPSFLSSLIEMQAIGRVTSRPAQPRKPTRTDATISADFVNMLLSELARECVDQTECPAFGSYRYATYIDEPRALSLLLEDGDMSRLTFRFRVGSGGQRDATVMIALPMMIERHRRPRTEAPEMTPNLPAAPLLSARENGAIRQAVSLAKAVQDAPVRLNGILCRRKLSLNLVRNLVPGTLIPLPASVLDDARIETLQGQLLARGRLGEAEGFHAIRLRSLGADGTAPGTDAAAGKMGFAPQTHLPERTTPAPDEPPLADYHSTDAFRDPRPAAAGGVQKAAG